MKKRRRISEAVATKECQRLAAGYHKGRKGHEGIRATESSCVSPNQVRVITYDSKFSVSERLTVFASFLW